jgi:large subunit ribosomal protein L47
MFLAKTFGRTFFAAAARSKHYSTTAAAARNPLQEFFEPERDIDNEQPVVYGMKYAPVLFIQNRN